MADAKKRIGIVLCFCILIAAAILQIRACSMDLPRLFDRLAVDDTFLYLQIARNVAQGKGLTFDGIHTTNGFQPLWLIASLPLAIIFKEPESFFRACLYLCAFFNVLTMWVLHKVGLRLGGRSAALSLMGGFLWVLTRWRPFLSGMETSLYLLIFTILLLELLKTLPSTFRLSAIGGLLILCRVDAVLFVIAGFLAFKPASKRSVLKLIFPLIIITAPYFVWNQVSFGSLLPVSGEVKSLYYTQELGEEYLQEGHVTKTLSVYLPRAAMSIASRFTAPLNRVTEERLAPKAVWMCILSLGLIALARRKRGTLVILSLAGILHLFIMVASIGRFSILDWYYAPQILIILIGATIGISWIYRLVLKRCFPVTVLLFCCTIGFAIWTGWNSLNPMPEEWDLYQRRYRMAIWLKKHLPSDAVIGAWNAGQIAYFSERTVVNLDGLVNDSRYLDMLKEKRPVLEYIEKENIEYIVDYDAIDLSMPPDKTWNPNREFRGEVPRNKLKIIRKYPRSGRDPHTLFVFKVRRPRHKNDPHKAGLNHTAEPDPNQPPPGRWRQYGTHRYDTGLSEDQREIIERLESIGYLSGSAEARIAGGITIHDKDAAYRGLNFYTSGHAPEAVLMDMDGNILNTWRYEFNAVWPDYPVSEYATNRDFWRRAYLYENGDILAIYEGLGIIKLDKKSNLIWANPCRAHHDLDVLPNGDIYLLTREARLIPRVSEHNPILEDFVSILDSNGREKKRVSILECFENSEDFRDLWLQRKEDDIHLQKTHNKGAGDIFHTNTVHVLMHPCTNHPPAFRKGNILTSILQMDAIAVMDIRREEIVWAYQGDFKKQHDPRILDNGNLLLFDNQGKPGRSRILEYDLSTMETVWVYEGTGKQPFYSETCGTSQRLPNGNTLITESDAGRAFEITPDKTIVWEFHNPHRAGDRKQFIATLFEVYRLDPDFPILWTRAMIETTRPSVNTDQERDY